MVKEFSWKQLHAADTSVEIIQRRYFSTAYNRNAKRFYFFGGQKPSKVQCDDFTFFELDTKAYKSASRDGQFPSPRAGHSCTVHNGKMYIFGGLQNKTSLNDFFSFDFEKETWTQIQPKAPDAPWPSPREHHSALIYNNEMYIFGGSNGIKKYKNDLWKYDFENNTFTELKYGSEQTLEGRAGHLAFLREHEFYIFGGYCGDGGFTYLGDSFVLNFAAAEAERKWKKVEFAGLAPGTARQISHVEFNHRLYVFGGYAGDGPNGMLRILDKQKLEWEFGELWMSIEEGNVPGQSGSKQMKPFARYGHGIGIDDDENVYVFFGTGSTYLTDIIQISSLD